MWHSLTFVIRTCARILDSARRTHLAVTERQCYHEYVALCLHCSSGDNPISLWTSVAVPDLVLLGLSALEHLDLSGITIGGLYHDRMLAVTHSYADGGSPLALALPTSLTSLIVAGTTISGLAKTCAPL